MLVAFKRATKREVAARPFKTLDELVKVKGMGVKMLDKLKGGLSL